MKKQATSGWRGNKETISRTVIPVMSGKAGKVSDKRREGLVKKQWTKQNRERPLIPQ